MPSGKITWSTWGLMFSQGKRRSAATSISASKCPMLQTIASFFIACTCSRVMTRTLPVAVTKMSATGAASSIVTTR